MNIHIAVLTMGNQTNIDRLFSDLFWSSVWGRVKTVYVLSQVNPVQITPKYYTNPHLMMSVASQNLGCAGGRKVLTKAIIEAMSEKDFKPDDVIVYLDDDIEILNCDWLRQLVEPLIWKHWLVGYSISGVAGRRLTGDLLTEEYQQNPDYVSGGWCAIRGDVFLDGCMFDEKFYPNYFEDVDLCYQARAKGKRIIAVGDIGLKHEHLAGESAAKIVDENRQKFGRKWGLL